MKSKFLPIVIFLLIPIGIYSQCPGSTAISYKNKAKNLGPQEFSKQQAYIWLATYYAYKCECDNGSPRSQQLVGMINGIVDTYSAYTKNAYGSISKVSTCKAQNGTGNSEITGETGDPNASNHGSGISIEPKKSFIQELTEDIGLNENVVQLMLEGNNEEALKLMKRNSQVNQLSKNLDGNLALANTFYDAVEELTNKMTENWNLNSEKFINHINQYKIENSTVKVKKDFSYKANFDDLNWSKIENSRIKSDVIEKNSVKISVISDIKKSDLEFDDIYFLAFQNDSFSLENDFVIKVEIEYRISSLKDWYNQPTLAMFLSQVNKVGFGAQYSSFRYSFTPFRNLYGGKLSGLLGNQNSIKPIFNTQKGDFNKAHFNDTWALTTNDQAKWMKSAHKGTIEANKSIKKLIKNNKGSLERITFNYKIAKHNNKIWLEVENIDDNNGTKIYARTREIDFEYIKDNIVFLGIAGPLKEGDTFILKNLEITQ